MKKEDLVKAIGEAEDQYVLAASPGPVRGSFVKVVIPIAASVAVLLIAGVFSLRLFSGRIKSNEDANDFDSDVLVGFSYKNEAWDSYEESDAEEEGAEALEEYAEAGEEYLMEAEQEEEKETLAQEPTVLETSTAAVSLRSETSEELLRLFLEEAELSVLSPEAAWLTADEAEALLDGSELLKTVSLREDRVEAVLKIQTEEENGSNTWKFLNYLLSKWTEAETD